nr:hypothetical protein [Anaerolineae bacterium]
EPELLRALLEAEPDERFRVIVHLREQADLKTAVGGALSATEARARVVSALQATAARSQRLLRAYLAGMQAAGTVRSYTPFWIVNAIAIHAARDTVFALAARPEIAAVHLDHYRQWITNQPTTHPPNGTSPASAPTRSGTRCISAAPARSWPGWIRGWTGCTRRCRPTTGATIPTARPTTSATGTTPPTAALFIPWTATGTAATRWAPSSDKKASAWLRGRAGSRSRCSTTRAMATTPGFTRAFSGSWLPAATRPKRLTWSTAPGATTTAT